MTSIRSTLWPRSLCPAGCLEKLQLHGNQLRHLPSSISGLVSLQSLSVQSNALRSLPDGITCLQASAVLLKHNRVLFDATPATQVALEASSPLT